MILDEITLHNFSLYQGHQNIKLSPPSPKQPVVLFGGLNGRGKTTLLDALQLNLFGRYAACSNRGSLNYEEFLRKCINKNTNPNEGTKLEIEFRHFSNYKENKYRVCRSWYDKGNGIKESLEIFQNDKLDRVLTDSWAEYVEEFIPIRLSNLFFFDGEKIEQLAEFEKSSELLSTAIYSLLGLDIVDRLTTDLVVIERRKKTTLKSDIEQRKINEAKLLLEHLEKEYQDMLMERASIQNNVDYNEKKLREVETLFQAEGGTLFENRERIEQERAKTIETISQLENQLQDMAASSLPLILVTPLFDSVIQQNQIETTIIQAEILDSAFAQRDKRLINKLKAFSLPKNVLEEIKSFLVEDRKIVCSNNQPVYLNLSEETKENIRTLKKTLLTECQTKTQNVIEQLDNMQSLLVDLDRKLASIPDKESLIELINQRQHNKDLLENSVKKLNTLDINLERIKREKEHKQANLIRLVEANVEEKLEQEDAQRIITYSKKVRGTIEKFRSSVVAHHIRNIEKVVLECFQKLVRKESLVTDLKIDIHEFTIQLSGSNNQIISQDRLSAGERQLLAVSILWGLAKVSDRRLPAIIDTPLGRLDSIHRMNLVERYFPYASHQVLLLSTDEEIDKYHYEKLKPWVGHSYRLDFDDSLGSTQVNTGYFW